MVPEAGWDAALSWLRAQIDAFEADAVYVHAHDCDNAIACGYDSCNCPWPKRLRMAAESDRRLLDHVVDQLADRGGDNPWWYADRLTPIVKALAVRFAHLPDFPEVLRLEGADA